MKTATIEDLQTRLDTILTWVRSGEDVVVKGEPAAKTNPAEEKVDWSKSAVFQRPPTGKLDMTGEELQEFYQDMRGSY
ncbi:MAG: hypothetical protein ABIZ56_03815 [Chthoniobacteraceae bacterium]